MVIPSSTTARACHDRNAAGAYSAWTPITSQRGATAYHYDLKAKTQTAQKPGEYDLTEAISFYEAASYMYKHGLYRELTTDEFSRYTALGQAQLKTPAVVNNP